ncbi:MAG: iron-containing redox enzyme family protein [Pseudomonadales bacterium]|nr:iron-containing redox enzyme family protein [Pseudomonadales bacterium]
MSFYEQLVLATEQHRRHVFEAPLVTAALAGNISLETYVAFLTQAYHHVKHTVPLLMATGARLPESHEWLREAVAEYIEEECGHQEWILNDIDACGFDKEAVRRGQPSIATELMVSYAYDQVNRVNPLAFFGMVQVLEGTSIKAATQAGQAIEASLGLPKKAFSYLYSHGDLDQQHICFFEKLMNRIDNKDEQEVIVHSAQVFYKLYGDIFRSIEVRDRDNRLLAGEVNDAA